MSEPRKRPSLRAATLTDRPEVDVLDRVYTVRPITRSVQNKLAEMESEIEKAADGDEEFAIVADRFDVLLAPVDGQRTPASKLLLDAWKADQLDSPQVAEFFEDVLRLAAERPT